MRTRAAFLLPIVFGALSCTEASPPAALGAKLPTSILADEATHMLAQAKPLPGSLCAGKPDLAIEALTFAPETVTFYGITGPRIYPLLGRMWACAKIRNVGAVAWGSAVDQWNVAVGTADSNIAGTLPGVPALAPGATVERCNGMDVPLLLRVGHDTPRAGECTVTATITSRIILDPDLTNDALASNDDCLTKNNTKSASLDYMASCPW